jgi:t-SNARE complex subunit (syntaxin)
VEVTTMPSQLQRRQRTRGWALYGVTLVTIVVIVALVQIVGHEAGDLAVKINQGLAH